MKNSIGIFIFVLLILVIFLPSYSRMQDLEAKNLEYQRKIHQLEKRQAALKEEKRLLEEDPVYLEKVAREKMGLIKEGEVIYRIQPENSVK